ncbi:hypothetical protein [Cerasicoccus maritimus]|uniref:hypothetical protein n=1 Tax=Cerasicoccus maritimus TaxID=490089 RepID=UPI0028529231|nr:hypothetical protein [Cerasicoccus maritimus]
MITHSIKYASIFLSLTATSPICTAQSQLPEEQLNVTWRAISVNRTIKDLYVQSGDAFERVFIPNGALSKPYQYSGAAPMLLYKRQEDSAEPLPVADVMLDASVRRALVFIKQYSGDGVAAEAMPMPTEPLHNGESRLINMTSSQIAGRLNGMKFQLAPRESTVLPFESDNPGVIKVSIQLAAKEGEGWEPKINSTFGVTPDMSVHLIFIPGSNGRVEMIPMRERLKSTPTDQAQQAQ